MINYLSVEATTSTLLSPSECSGQLTHLHFELVADVAPVELRADQFELPVEQRHRVPVPVADQVQNLLVVSHGVNPCGQRHTGATAALQKTGTTSYTGQILLHFFI